MILVDTSVWIDHLREGFAPLSEALEQGRVLMHPIVIGELACGNLSNRAELLRLLGELPRAKVATFDEALGGAAAATPLQKLHAQARDVS